MENNKTGDNKIIETAAFDNIFRGYILIFLDVNVFHIDIVPDIIGFYLIGKAMASLAPRVSILQRGQKVALLLLLISVADAVAQFVRGMNADNINSIFHVEVPETDFFVFTPWVIYYGACLCISVWLMANILSGIASLSLQKNQNRLCETTLRYRRLLIGIYLPAGMMLLFKESCFHFSYSNPSTAVLDGLGVFFNMLMVCFYCLLVLHVGNLQTNLYG